MTSVGRLVETRVDWRERGETRVECGARWVFAHTPSRASWRTHRRSKFEPAFACIAPERKNIDYLYVMDLPFIVRMDLLFGWFMLGSKIYCFDDGFSQGSPISPGAANLHASVKESHFLATLSQQDRQSFHRLATAA